MDWIFSNEAANFGRFVGGISVVAAVMILIEERDGVIGEKTN